MKRGLLLTAAAGGLFGVSMWVQAMSASGTTGAGLAAYPTLIAASFSDEPVKQTLPADWLNDMRWRCIGPANMGGRITDIAVSEQRRTTWWAATASGGLLKTSDNGITFEHQFDRETSVSIGAIAVAPSDDSIVWVGTGESNPRNSVSYGDGVYKSTDGGKTWTRMGLENTYSIGRIVIHPDNPDVVYVGAMGRVWGENPERGLYKTADGGKTWRKILHVDEKTGVIDMDMHPTEPDTLLVATWERQRDEFDTNDPAKKWGPGSALYRTTDGGESFTKITEGIPPCNLGRMSIDYFPADPKIVYLTVDCEWIGKVDETAPYMGLSGADAEAGTRVTRIVDDGPAGKAGIQRDDIILSLDGEIVLTWDALQKKINDRKAGDKVTFGIARGKEALNVELTLASRAEENPTPFVDRLGGQAQNIQDQQGKDGWKYGGVYRSEDGGISWTRVNSLNPRPMYFSRIRVDPNDDQKVWVLGVQQHRSDDGGKTFNNRAAPGVHADGHAIWIDPGDERHVILGVDGGVYVTYDGGSNWDHLNHTAIGQFYHVAIDSQPLPMIYGGLQDNGSWGGPTMTRAGGPVNEDWFRIGGGDGFVCRVDPNDPDQIYYESQNGATGQRNLRTGRGTSIRPPREEGITYRFNWNTPFILSSHNSKIYYNAGNYVFRSLNTGEGLRRISPEITRTERGSATALAESPVDPNVLYVGTDDGAVFGTTDGGYTWTDLFNYSPPSNSQEIPPEKIGETQEQTVEVSALPPGEDGWLDERLDAEQPEQPEPPPTPRRGGGRGAFNPQDMLDRLDTNGDGRITRDEIPERMTQFLERLDTNKDGAIDKAELEAMAANVRRGGEGQPGTPPARPITAGAVVAESEPEETETQPQTLPSDAVTGTWRMRVTSELPRGSGEFTLRLKLDGRTVTGEIDSEAFQGPISSGTFDPDSGRLRFEFEGVMGRAQYTATIRNDRMAGALTLGGGEFSIEFEGARAAPAAAAAQPGAETRQRTLRRRDAVQPGDVLSSLVPHHMGVSAIEASRFEAGRVYMTLDGHRNDNDAPWVFVSEDYGRTWRSITANLPARGSTRVIREDITSPDILYVGTEFGAFVSINRGGDWTSLNTNLPTVAVHEFAQHPTNGEIAVATHGRSIWMFDATTIRQLNAERLAADAHLYEPNTVVLWRSQPSRGISGARVYQGDNPRTGAAIFYSLGKEAREVTLTVTELDGTPIRELQVDGKTPGMHSQTWDLRMQPQQGENQGPQRFGGGRGRQVDPGTYRIVLNADGVERTTTLRIIGDPAYPSDFLSADEAANDTTHLEGMEEEEEGGEQEEAEVIR